jgi:hypothetical protein
LLFSFTYQRDLFNQQTLFGILQQLLLFFWHQKINFGTSEPLLCNQRLVYPYKKTGLMNYDHESN